MRSEADEGESKQQEMNPTQKKLFELRLKLNACRKANKAEVVEEHKRVTDPNYHKKTTLKRKQDEADATNPDNSETTTREDEEKTYLNHTIEEHSVKLKKAKQKSKHKASFGWDVFNQDALYNAYKKRLTKLPTGAASSEQQQQDDINSLNYGRNDFVSEAGVAQMVGELEERAQARQKFSRRRQHQEGKDVDYINDRNKHFNDKISRAFDKYTVEIRQNLERGTAL